LLALLVPLLSTTLTAGAAPDPGKSAQLKEAIEGASAEETLAYQQYQDARAKRTELDNKVAALEAQLATASANLQAAEAEVARIQAKVDAVQLEVDRIQGEIMKSRDLFQQSAVDIYKNGSGGGSLGLLSSSGDSHELISQSKYNTENSRRLERELLRQGGLRDELGDARDDLKKEGAKAEDAERAAQTERDRVGTLKAEADAQRAEAASAEEQEQQVLASVQAKKAQYESELAAEQARIAAELRPGGSAGLSSGGGSGRVQWPLQGPLNSGFGYRQDPFGQGTRLHTGLDIGADTGTPIHAAASGTVNSAGWNGGYGNCVIIDHGDGLATLYGHQSRIAVSAGQMVNQGDVIGYVGSTGNSTGPHLHFEVRVNGEPENPLNYLP
jgi:murein DD-endopeptidase MepM/ murein hydrolase activator NlpD